MRNVVIKGVSAFGALALVAAFMSGAAASRPPPLRAQSVSAKNATVNGNLAVTGSARIGSGLRVDGNVDAYKRVTAHAGLRLYQGLDVRSGGVKTDSLTVAGSGGLVVQSGGIKSDSLLVSGGLKAANATIDSNLQAGALSARTLQVSDSATVNGVLTTTGAASIGGALTASGKITGNGVDTGSGGLTTSAINDAGPASINGGLTVKGSLDLSQASIVGFSPQFSTFNAQTANIGVPSGTTGPLNVSENGQTVQVGVNGNGALTLNSLATSGGLTVGGNASVAGNLTVSGSGGIVAGMLQAPTPSGATGPGPLSLQGSSITLSGTTTLAGGSDLGLSAGSGSNYSHVVANGDTDVAGIATVNVPASTAAGTAETASVSFHKNYSSEPAVELTPVGDPAPGSNSMPKYWVELSTSTSGSSTVYTGFVVHYVSPVTSPGTQTGFKFYYHVIGS